MWDRHRLRRRRVVLAETIHRSHELLKGDDAPEFLSFTEGAVRRFPADTELRLMYASALSLNTRSGEAATQAATAVSFDTTDPETLTRAAATLFFCGEYDAAESYVQRAKRFAPPDFIFADELRHVELKLGEQRRDEFR